MEHLANILAKIDDIVWGPLMLVLLVGTGIFLTVRTKFLPWRNLGYALKSTLSKEARQKTEGEGDISPFSALMTALAATIGTGNIVGVATAMVSGGPGALVWMWISACFGLSSKFSECMLAIKYRQTNEKGEMSGGPMFTMKNGFKNKKLGSILGWLFALFAVLASFGVGNLTQANSISTSMETTFHISPAVTGIVLMLLTLFIIVGGIENISKVSQVVVPFMAVFYVVAGLIVIIGNIENVPRGVAMIISMAFSTKAVTGGVLGTIVASMMNAMRFGVARGIFSNEAGMGSAAISAAAATTNSHVRQGYISMTGTFWDTLVVCTITGLCIASSGVLGSRTLAQTGTYTIEHETVILTYSENNKDSNAAYAIDVDTNSQDAGITVTLTPTRENKGAAAIALTPYETPNTKASAKNLTGQWQDEAGNVYFFEEDGTYKMETLTIGAPLTIAAFESVLGKPGSIIVCIGIALFAFSTILGWEYNGEKALEYILGTPKFHFIYRIVFSLIVYIGATTSIKIAWSFSDIANALMAIPNLICLLALSGVVAKDMQEYQAVIKAEKAAKKNRK